MKNRLPDRRGQVIVEYMLLLVVTAALAVLLLKTLASRKDGNNAGVIVHAWRNLENEIGGEIIDKCQGTSCNQ